MFDLLCRLFRPANAVPMLLQRTQRSSLVQLYARIKLVSPTLRRQHLRPRQSSLRTLIA